jgi:hypothetical protein
MVKHLFDDGNLYGWLADGRDSTTNRQAAAAALRALPF